MQVLQPPFDLNVADFSKQKGCVELTEREAYVAFNMTERVGAVAVTKLVARFGSVAAAWDAYPNKISRGGGEVDWRGELEKAQSLGVNVITPADAEYPAQLLSAGGYPLALYVKGDAKVLSRPAIAMVGTRKATSYGLDQAYRFGRDLAANGWVVISGLALGIDAESHRGALAGGGLTVGVLGSALNRFYPPENLTLAQEIVKKGGAVVSEFPLGREPDQRSFPQRNHVVAGLSRAVIAVEAPAKSGTMITMGLAADLGRTVMAIPGRVDNPASAGCLSLIRDGAILVRCPQDVEQELSYLPGMNVRTAAVKGAMEAPEDADHPALSGDEAAVMLEVASVPEGLSVDELVRKTGLSAGAVNSASMSLLLKSRVRFLGDGRIALPRK